MYYNVKKKQLLRVDINDVQPNSGTVGSNREHKTPATYVIVTDSSLFYVGSTSRINGRTNKHKWLLENNQHPIKALQAAYNAGEQLVMTVFHTKNREEAFDLEQNYLDYSKGDPNLTNKAMCARIPSLGIKPSAHNIQRIKETHTGKIVSEETREKLSKIHKGKKLTEEQKNHLSKINTGKFLSLETINKIREKNTGRVHGLDFAKKISESKKGMVISQEWRDRLKLMARTKSVQVEGIKYSSLEEAGKALQISPTTVSKRVKSNSENFKNWNFTNSEIKDMSELRIPSSNCEFLPDHRRFKKMPENLILVFESNLQGRHNSSVARDALRYFGAVYGIGEGFQGQTYGLPTCSIPGEGLSLQDIQKHVDKFKKAVKDNPRLSFFVTAVGCGYAGYEAKDIAPMFKGLERCWFPESWKPYL